MGLITIESDDWNQPIDELIKTMKETNKILQDISNSLTRINGEK